MLLSSISEFCLQFNFGYCQHKVLSHGGATYEILAAFGRESGLGLDIGAEKRRAGAAGCVRHSRDATDRSRSSRLGRGFCESCRLAVVTTLVPAQSL